MRNGVAEPDPVTSTPLLMDRPDQWPQAVSTESKLLFCIAGGTHKSQLTNCTDSYSFVSLPSRTKCQKDVAAPQTYAVIIVMKPLKYTVVHQHQYHNHYSMDGTFRTAEVRVNNQPKGTIN